MPTAQVTNSLADISEYLWSVTIAKENAFRNGSINNGRNIVLYMENKSLSYALAQGLDTTGIDGYVYALIGAKLQQAYEVYSSGSGGVVPSPSGGGIVGYTPYPINITVDVSQTGGMTLSALVPSDWVGLLLFTECTINQSVYQLNSGFTYNVVTGQFNFSLSSYYPQPGDKFTCNAFKAS